MCARCVSYCLFIAKIGERGLGCTVGRSGFSSPLPRLAVEQTFPAAVAPVGRRPNSGPRLCLGSRPVGSFVRAFRIVWLVMQCVWSSDHVAFGSFLWLHHFVLVRFVSSFTRFVRSSVVGGCVAFLRDWVAASLRSGIDTE